MQRLFITILYMLVYAVDPILWGILFFSVFGKKKENKWYYIGAFSFLYIIMLVKQTMAFLGNAPVGVGLMFLILTLILGYSIILFDGDFQLKIAVLSVIFVLTSMIEHIAEFVCLRVIQLPFESIASFGFANLIILASVKIADMIVYAFVIVALKKKYRFLCIRELAPMILLSLVSIMPICYLFYSHLKSEERIHFFNEMLSLQLILEISLLGYIGLILYRKRKKELKDKETIEFIKAQLSLYGNITDYADEVKGVQQHMKSNLCSVLLLLKQNQVEKAEQYIENLLSNIMLKDNVYELENTLLAVLIFEQKLKAEKRKIDVNFQIEVQDIPVETGDLSCIVNSMFEHAIEVCEKVSDREKRNIFFEVVERDGMIEIVCRNSMMMKEEAIGEKDSALSRMDRIYQKFGIQKIRNAVERNHGHMAVRFNPGEFVIKAVFDNTVSMEV